jgi:hypothetical protein
MIDTVNEVVATVEVPNVPFKVRVKVYYADKGDQS